MTVLTPAEWTLLSVLPDSEEGALCFGGTARVAKHLAELGYATAVGQLVGDSGYFARTEKGRLLVRASLDAP